jgi:hypothetical protein
LPIATPVGCGGVVRGTTVGETNKLNGYSCYVGDEHGPDALFVITTTETALLSAALTGLSADLDVFILSAPTPSACLVYGDNTATLPLAPSGVYYVSVDGFAGAAGSYTLSLICGNVTATATATATASVSRTPTATLSPRLCFPIIVKDYSSLF